MSCFSGSTVSTLTRKRLVELQDGLNNGTPINVARSNGWPMAPHKTQRRIRPTYGLSIPYPFAGAYAGRTLYEAPFPGVVNEATGLSYRFEMIPRLACRLHDDSP